MKHGDLIRFDPIESVVQLKSAGIREEYGQRPGVERATRHVLRSLLDWSVLSGTGTPELYRGWPPIPIQGTQLSGRLAEAVLRSRAARAGSPGELIAGPRLLPFRAESCPAGRRLRSRRVWIFCGTASTANH